MNYADKMRKEILRRIELGTFEFKEFFPDSKNAQKEEKQKTALPLFSKIAESWLISKERKLAGTTLKEYRNTIDTHFLEPFGNRVMADITFLDIDQLMSGLEVSNKTFNNILSVLRGVYEYGVKAKACAENHAKQIEFTKKEETEPDPLLPEEISMVLADMSKHYEEQVEIYFGLAFMIGFRPSEGIDLRWSNIDWNKKTLKISTAKVRFIEKDTKTGKSRIVELDDECMALLTRLKKHTFMKGDYLFTYPETGRPYTDTSYLVQRYWRPSLKRCKIRDRDARQARHTCATLMLMSGCRTRWAAGQLGHSPEMFERVYSKWMPEIDKGRERAKMSAMFQTETKAVAGEQK